MCSLSLSGPAPHAEPRLEQHLLGLLVLIPLISLALLPRHSSSSVDALLPRHGTDDNLTRKGESRF